MKARTKAIWETERSQNHGYSKDGKTPIELILQALTEIRISTHNTSESKLKVLI